MQRRWTLLNPGPTNVSDRVLQAAATEPLCHREPEYTALQNDVRARLLRILNLDPDVWAAVLVAGSGTAAVEMAVLGAVPAGKRLLVAINGVYGDRIAKMARAHGIEVVEVRSPWGEPADPEALAAACRDNPEVGCLAAIHHETTTGLLNPIAEIGAVARECGVRYLLDSVSGVAGDFIDLDGMHVDVCACTGGKNLQGLVGVSFAYVRREVVDALQGREPRSVYLDLAGLCAKQDRGGTPFTPAVPLVAALREALVELEEETVVGRVARYGDAAQFLREGYARLGLASYLPAGTPLSNCLTTLRLPEGRTYADLHRSLKEQGFVIYAGQGKLEQEAFRIANMGNVERAEYQRLLDCLGRWIEA